MTALWRRLFGRKDELDDSTTAYIEGSASPAEVDAVRREIGESTERGREIEELRQTVALLRSVETPAAPRSFALTPDMVPAERWTPRLNLTYAPAATAAVLALVVGALVAGDVADVLRQSEPAGVESMSESSPTADAENLVQDQYDGPAAGTIVTEKVTTGEAQPVVVQVIETVVVENPVTRAEKVVDTVVVRKPVTRTEKAVETVVVEKPVTRTEKVVGTVAVEKEVTGTEKVVETAAVEIPVTRTEKVVEKVTSLRAVEAEANDEVPTDVTPVGRPEATLQVAATTVPMAVRQTVSAMGTPTSASAKTTRAPAVVAVARVEPTTQPAATAVPKVEPTTQPAATLAPTPEPTTQPAATLAPTPEPTTRPIPTPNIPDEPSAQVEVNAHDDSGISLPLWQLEVLLALLAGLMVALWAALRQRSARRTWPHADV